MKKILSLLLAGILLTGCLTACGSEEAETVEDTAAVETEAETEAETEPETEKETEPPKPKMVEVFTPIYTENFDDAAATKWKANAQLKDFAVADGYLTATSIGGDPSIAANTFDLNCEDIDAIRIRYINGTANDQLQIFFTTDASNTAYSEPGSFKEYCWYTESVVTVADAAASEEWNELVVYTEYNDLWTGILKNMRMDLSNAEGNYIVDSIEFCSVELVEEAAQ